MMGINKEYSKGMFHPFFCYSSVYKYEFLLSIAFAII